MTGNPTSSTARALIAACLAEPDEDGPRLAYADLVEEEGDVEHAELIRVQCARESWRQDDAERSLSKDGIAWRAELVARESALLPTLRARLMPCPGPCKGSGWYTCEPLPLLGECTICKRSGICPGDLVRGFPVCKVPLSECGREEISCVRCEAVLEAGFCHICDTVRGGDLAKRVWQPAPWLAAARERGATVEVSDREPSEFNAESGKSKWVWIKTLPDEYPTGSDLPTPLFDAIEDGDVQGDGTLPHSKQFSSRATAVAALGRAVMGITSGSSGESSAC